MAKIICDYCGKEYQVDDIQNDPICPNCKTNNRTGVRRPTKLSALEIFFLVLSVFIICICILMFLVSRNKYISPEETRTAIAPITVFSVVLVYIYIRHAKELSLYKLSKKNQEQYRIELRSFLKQTDDKQAEDQAKTINRLAHTPACPICGSKQNVVRVTALDRSVSTAVWGVASDAIGKQWECTACHHKFNADTVVQRPTAPTQPSQATTTDPTEELRKYKKLLDDGIITKEEFEKKKNKLLGL